MKGSGSHVVGVKKRRIGNENSPPGTTSDATPPGHPSSVRASPRHSVYRNIGLYTSSLFLLLSLYLLCYNKST